MYLTVLVPVYNEESVIEAFHTRLTAVLNAIELAAEILFINDGSTDSSLQLIEQLAARDDRVSFLNLSRNFGKENAMSAGIDRADGDAVVIIDADLQDPPELIPDMLDLWSQGYDTVYARRASRQGESFFKKFTSRHFYRLMGKLSKVDIPKNTGDFRLISRRSVLALRGLPESHRFMKGLFAWIGYKQGEIVYERQGRHAGKSKFSYWRLWNFALDGITAFSTAPLKLATYFGLTLSLLSLLYGSWIVIETLMFGGDVPGYPSLMTVVLFLGGIQLFFLGILGEYLGRMFDESKRRPLYLVEKYHAAAVVSDENKEHNTDG